MFEDRAVSTQPAPSAARFSRLLTSTILSGTVLCSGALPASAQALADTAVELSELSVTGEGRGLTRSSTASC